MSASSGDTGKRHWSPYAPAVVWSLVHPAENSVFLNEGVAKGWHVSGSPEIGVGQQQAVEDLDGNVVVYETTEYEHEQRAMTQLISPPQIYDLRSINEVEPRGSGCVFAHTVEVVLPLGLPAVPKETQAELRAYARDYIARVAKAIGPWMASQG